MSFAGHALRRIDIRCDLFMGSVYGNRDRGRPKTRYKVFVSQMFSFCLLLILVKSQGGLQPNIFEAVDSNYQFFVFFIPKPLNGQYLAARHLNL